jgi:hypothetical protein
MHSLQGEGNAYMDAGSSAALLCMSFKVDDLLPGCVTAVFAYFLL